MKTGQNSVLNKTVVVDVPSIGNVDVLIKQAEFVDGRPSPCRIGSVSGTFTIDGAPIEAAVRLNDRVISETTTSNDALLAKLYEDTGWGAFDIFVVAIDIIVKAIEQGLEA